MANKKNRTRVGVLGDDLDKRETTKKINFILEGPKETWYTIQEIVDLGQDKYGLNFPTKETISRYLNSMMDDKKVEVKKPEKKGLAYKWRLKKHLYVYEDLVFDYDLNVLNELKDYITPLQRDMHNILVFGPVTICNFPLYDFKECREEIKEAVVILKDATDKLDELYIGRILHLVTNYIDTLNEMKAPLLDKQLISIFTSGLENKVPLDHRLCKWDKQINEWIRETIPADNEEEKRLVVSKDLSLAKLLKSEYYPSKGDDEVLELIADYHIGKNIGDCFLHLYLMLSDVVMMPHPIVIVRSNVTDRKDLANSYSKRRILARKGLLIDKKIVK